MANVAYRMTGYCSEKSMLYLKACLANGWTEGQISMFRKWLPSFESACIKSPFDDALDSFVEEPDKAHLPFLNSLYRHVRQITLNERLEEIQRKASSENHKDSIAAYTALASTLPVGLEDGEEEIANAEIHFHVKERKSSVNVTRGKKAKAPAE